MADTTVQNNCYSFGVTVGNSGDYYNFAQNHVFDLDEGHVPLKWVFFTNTGATENVTISFVGATGGLKLGPGEMSPVLPGPWFGMHAINDGAGDVTLHIVGGY